MLQLKQQYATRIQLHGRCMLRLTLQLNIAALRYARCCVAFLQGVMTAVNDLTAALCADAYHAMQAGDLGRLQLADSGKNFQFR